MEVVFVKIMYTFLGFLLGVCLMVLLTMARENDEQVND